MSIFKTEFQKAAAQAVSEFIKAPESKWYAGHQETSVAVKDDGVHVRFSTVRGTPESLRNRQMDTLIQLADCGLTVEIPEDKKADADGVRTDTIATGVSSCEVLLRADANGGFSQIAAKLNKAMGKETPSRGGVMNTVGSTRHRDMIAAERFKGSDKANSR